MKRIHRKGSSKLAAFAMLGLGISIIAVSVVYTSSLLAILGVALTFWGTIILYVTPTKHVPLNLLNAAVAAGTSNIERVLIECGITNKGIYLPPKNVTDIESSLIFIPEKTSQPLPKREDIADGKLFTSNCKGIILTPPGFTLSQLFEQELQLVFTKTSLKQLQEKLPKLLVETLALAEDVKIQNQGNTITIQIINNVLAEVCQKNRKYSLAHNAVGCLLPSAIACALAKATGKPIIISEEAHNPENKTTTIQYQIMEE